MRTPEHSVHAYLLAPPNTNFAIGDESAGPPVVSPDGTHMAFVARSVDGKNTLWVQALDSGVAKQLEGTDGASYEFWSADSKNLAFFAEGKLKIIDASGGPPQALCDATSGRGGTWNRDGVILFTASTTGGLSRISAAGGTPEPVTTIDAKELSHRWAQFLPDGKHFIYYSRAVDPDDSALYAASLDSKERKLLVKSGSGGIYAAPGYLLYVNQGALLAQPFDAAHLTLTGAARPLADHVAVNGNTWLGIVSASSNGVLLYQQGTLAAGSQVVWYDRSGRREGTILPDDAEHFAPRLSPDGKKLAVGIEMNGIINIWVVDLERNTKTRITFGTLNNSIPVWSPDGKTLFFGSSRPDAPDPYGHIYSVAADGTGAPEKVLASPQLAELPFSVSNDGRYLAYMRRDMSSNRSGGQCWVLPLFGDRKPFPFASSGQFQFFVPVISPDGKWVAYNSDQTGRPEIYIRPFPSGNGQWQVSTNGGTVAQWRADGKELFFLQGSQLMAVDVSEKGASLQLGTPHLLFTANFVTAASGAYSASPDGKKFIVNEIPEQVNSEPISLVTNWTADLKQ